MHYKYQITNFTVHCAPRSDLLGLISDGTECPKIYSKSVLHLLKYIFAVYLKKIQYRFAVHFGTLSTI